MTRGYDIEQNGIGLGLTVLLTLPLVWFMLCLSIGYAFGGSAQWTVRPYGPDVWAVSKTYGEGPHWSRSPLDVAAEQQEIIACKDIPSKPMADIITEALNRREAVK